MARAPLFTTRLASYCMAFAWGAISLSMGLKAVVYQNQLKSSLRRAVAPNGITLRLVTNNLVHPAIACEVFCVLTFIAGLIALVGLFVEKCNTRKAIQLQAYLFTFLTAALFATCIPVSNAIRTLAVEAWAWTADGTAISAEDLAATVASLGVNPQYRHLPYLLYFGIIPWFAFLFSLTSAVVSFIAANKVKDSAYTAEPTKREMAQADGIQAV